MLLLGVVLTAAFAIGHGWVLLRNVDERVDCRYHLGEPYWGGCAEQLLLLLSDKALTHILAHRLLYKPKK